MADPQDNPSYLKLDRDLWEDVREGLTKAQQAKLALAMIDFFFYGIDPREGALPKPVRLALQGQLKMLEAYRKNAIKGTQNRRAKSP